MTLPDDEVIETLRDFAVGWRNIHEDEHVGLSHGYRTSQTAVGTTNGAGGRNVQLIVMAPDETVLHVLPGFWHPEDLVRELRFAKTLFELWSDGARSEAQKRRLFFAMHQQFVRSLPAETIARSDWQNFDRNVELSRVGWAWGRGQEGSAPDEMRDTFARLPDGSVVRDEHGVAQLKPLSTLVHDRMRLRPFLRLAEFDMESFVDYGRPYYDNNSFDDGREFKAAERANKKREQERQRERERLAKLAQQEARKARK